MTAFWRVIATVLVLLGGVEMGREVELTVSRQALERTLKLKISIHLCRGCSFAKEPQGFERLARMAEETRNRFIGDIHAGDAFQKLPFPSDLRFRLRRDNMALHFRMRARIAERSRRRRISY